MFKEDLNDDIISSEAIWSFDNVEKELLRAYPNGQAISEEIRTIGGGHTWRVDFYPNGKDLKTFGQIILCVTLVKCASVDTDMVQAECSFSYKNIKRRKNFFGKIPLTAYEENQTEQDSSLDTAILKECGSSHPINITITINQYPEDYVYPTEKILSTPISSTKSLISSSSSSSFESSSATPRYNYIPGDKFDEDDFKKVKVNYLYNRNIYF